MKCPKLSAFLKDRASREGLSVRMLAAKIGISGASVQNYIDGTTRPSEEILEKIAAAFGVKLEDISDRRIVGTATQLHPAAKGLTGITQSLDEVLAEMAKKRLTPAERLELAGFTLRMMDELERKRLSGSLDEEGGRDRLHFAPCGAAEHQQGCGPG